MARRSYRQQRHRTHIKGYRQAGPIYVRWDDGVKVELVYDPVLDKWWVRHYYRNFKIRAHTKEGKPFHPLSAEPWRLPEQQFPDMTAGFNRTEHKAYIPPVPIQ